MADTVTTHFTQRLYEGARSIWLKQLEHPFVRALGEGTLPRSRFEFYIRQDALFLNELTKTFAYATTRTENSHEMQRFGELLLNTLQVEQALHQSYGEKFGLTPEQMAATRMAPTNYAYTRHLLHISATGSLPELVTAILPCAWIYAEVGRHFQEQGLPTEDHAYRDWLLTYASPGFEEVGIWLRGVVDDRAEGLDEGHRRRLVEIFLTSSRYEWMFWDMAWREEAWPV
ncbi:MAG: thiaminase II [Chloroflexota bacterium]|nr:thiaminase II [Chloroflexota bacterium]